MNHCHNKLIQLTREYISGEPAALVLILADENFDCDDTSLSSMSENIKVISNRVDVTDALTTQNIPCTYSDFVLDSTTPSFDAVFFRVSKERLVSHHCINQALRVLKPEGQLILIGRKEDGIKTYIDKTKKQFKLQGTSKKDKNTYSAHLVKARPTIDMAELDSNNYEQLRHITTTTINDYAFDLYSKPGVYGWKKIDPGSEFLLDTLIKEFHDNEPTFSDQEQRSALDLGCGSGYLSLGLSALGLTRITATDNNAAAILATQKTLTSNHIDVQIIASDCGDALENQVDLIICNPPFHKGFDTDRTLSLRFVKACERLLKRKGVAYFVCNSFVAIERLFKEQQLNCSEMAKNTQFKVLKITHARHH